MRGSRFEARGSRFEERGARGEARGSERAARVALVHDWLTGMRGGEKVLEAIAGLYPDAVLHTLVHVRGTVSPAIERLPVKRSLAQYLPGAARHYRQYLPLFPTLVEQFDLDPFDLVVSTSHCAVKSVVAPRRARHICYCHSPMRYAWDQFDAYFGPEAVGAARHRLMRAMLARLARWDAATAGRVDRFVANSQYVAGRIRRYYNRESIVVHPPVDTDFFQPAPVRPSAPYFLVVSALVPYKRLDLAIEAARQAHVPLKIVGRGPEEASLRRIAGSDVEFLGWLGDEDVRALYQGCTAVVMPGVEDFGMVPVEAQACGRPVVALAEGGAVETVVHGETGFLVQEPTAKAFAAAMSEAAQRTFDPSAIRRHAESFSRARFERAFRAVVDDVMSDKPAVRAASMPEGRDAAASAARWPQGDNPAASAARWPQGDNPAAREDKQ